MHSNTKTIIGILWLNAVSIVSPDKRGFADRYNLAKEQHLQGICAWVLGEEDPAIWTVLPDRK